MNTIYGYNISEATGDVNEKREREKKKMFLSFPVSGNASINIKMLTCVLSYRKRGTTNVEMITRLISKNLQT